MPTTWVEESWDGHLGPSADGESGFGGCAGVNEEGKTHWTGFCESSEYPWWQFVTKKRLVNKQDYPFCLCGKAIIISSL